MRNRFDCVGRGDIGVIDVIIEFGFMIRIFIVLVIIVY